MQLFSFNLLMNISLSVKNSHLFSQKAYHMQFDQQGILTSLRISVFGLAHGNADTLLCVGTMPRNGEQFVFSSFHSTF